MIFKTTKNLRALILASTLIVLSNSGVSLANIDISLDRQDAVKIEVTIDNPDEYGLYLLLEKVDRHLEKEDRKLAERIMRSGYDVGPPNQKSSDSDLLTFSVRVYEKSDAGMKIIFDEGELLPHLSMTFNEWFALEVAAVDLTEGNYIVEVVPELKNHALNNIPSKVIFIPANRGR